MTLWNIWPVLNDLMQANNGTLYPLQKISFLPVVPGASCLCLCKCVPAAQWTAVCCSLSTQVTLHSSERRTRMDSTFPAMAHTCRGVRCRLSCGRVQQWWPRVGLPMVILRIVSCDYSWGHLENYCKHCMHLLITMYVRLFCQRGTQPRSYVSILLESTRALLWLQYIAICITIVIYCHCNDRAIW